MAVTTQNVRKTASQKSRWQRTMFWALHINVVCIYIQESRGRDRNSREMAGRGVHGELSAHRDGGSSSSKSDAGDAGLSRLLSL